METYTKVNLAVIWRTEKELYFGTMAVDSKGHGGTTCSTELAYKPGLTAANMKEGTTEEKSTGMAATFGQTKVNIAEIGRETQCLDLEEWFGLTVDAMTVNG